MRFDNFFDNLVVAYFFGPPCIYVCTPVIDIAGRSNLRSAQRGDMFVPRTRTEFGRRSFHVAAPAVWNALQQLISAQPPFLVDSSELG